MEFRIFFQLLQRCRSDLIGEFCFCGKSLHRQDLIAFIKYDPDIFFCRLFYADPVPFFPCKIVEQGVKRDVDRSVAVCPVQPCAVIPCDIVFHGDHRAIRHRHPVDIHHSHRLSGKAAAGDPRTDDTQSTQQEKLYFHFIFLLYRLKAGVF